MRRSFTLWFALAILCTASFTNAQTMLPIPPQGSTFGMTRGFWFQSPVDFTIVSVRVPTGVSGNYQSVQILRLPAAPPSYSANTNTFTSLHYSQNVLGTTAIPANVGISTGDIIMVLGARSTSNNTASCTNTNSYGPYTGTSYPSNVCGTPMNLTRAGFQAHICRGGAFNVWQEPIANYYISRVEVMYNCGILPAELSTFAGAARDNDIQLNWHTESETDFAYFEIERATEAAPASAVSQAQAPSSTVVGSDGVTIEDNSFFTDVAEWNNKNFEKIGQEVGRGAQNVAADYSFIDPDPKPGFNYYRLRKVDLNGSSSYSTVIEVAYQMEESRIAGIWPNPASEMAHIDVLSDLQQEADVQVFDLTGKLINNVRYVLSQGMNRIDWPVGDRAAGTYHLRVALESGKRLTGTVVVQ